MSTPGKRPFPSDGAENGDSKRARSINGSPAPAGNDDIERKKREAAERIAAIKARMGNLGQPAAPAPAAPANPTALSAAERIAAMKARMNGQAAPPPAAIAPSPVPDDKQAAMQARIAAMKAKLHSGSGAATPSPPPPTSDIAEKIAAAKAKALEFAQQRQAQQKEPAQRESQQRWPNRAPTPPLREDTTVKSRGGLNVGIHPSLLQQPSAVSGRGPSKGKGREDPSKPRSNPYLADDAVPSEVGAARKADPTYDASLTTSSTAGKTRKSRQLLFNQKGKFIAQANALRQQERLEEMRLRMQEESRKKAIEEATEKSYLVPAPPEIEWWDEALVVNPSYDSLDIENPATLNFDVITAYVQHPVLLAAPQESHMPAPKPMFLTKEEQKKVRRQRRMADHKEEQAKIRLGLKAPPPPKVKKSNLMRVLGQEAVKDPTAVEARVNREIAQRAADHEATNDERALTKEQRAEKLAQQQEADAAKGVYVCVFRIDNLSYGKHRFQISKNAEQNSLTGMTIFNPKMNLVIVEGGIHSINAYKKLMLNRIRWTENAMPVGVREGNREAEAEWLKATDERGVLKDLGGNRCQLVFEGEEREKMFKRWFPYRLCETDGEAKDMLSRYKMENMWTLAQSMDADVWA